MSLHPYTYANNEPVDFSEPTGAFSIGELAVVSAIVGTLVAVINLALGDTPGRAALKGVTAGAAVFAAGLVAIGAGVLVFGSAATVAVGGGAASAGALGSGAVVEPPTFPAPAVEEDVEALENFGGRIGENGRSMLDFATKMLDALRRYANTNSSNGVTFESLRVTEYIQNLGRYPHLAPSICFMAVAFRATYPAYALADPLFAESTGRALADEINNNPLLSWCTALSK